MIKNKKNPKKIEQAGTFIRFPKPMLASLDSFLKNNIYYSDRSQYVRIAVAEKMKKDCISMEGCDEKDIGKTKNPLIPNIPE